MKTNKIKTGITFLAILLSCCGFAFRASAQNRMSDVRVIVKDVFQDGDSIRAILDIEALGVSVSPREQLYLFPVIRSAGNERKMPPVVINVGIQQAVIDREEKLSGTVSPAYASFVARGRGLFHEKVQYSAAVKAEDWMRDAKVAMVQERGNCRGNLHRLSMEVIADGIRFMDKPVRPAAYDIPVAIPVPPREEIKMRTESGEAQIIYTVGNAEIKPSLGNNWNELDKIRRSIEDVRSVQGVKINSIIISSYASPEGTWQSNLTLSERRAASLTAWIRMNYDLRGISLTSRGYGEDWERLGELVAKDYVMSEYEKSAALGIINGHAAYDARETQLKSLSGGQTYRYMLSSLYPQLRRSAYRIEFTVPEYTIESIREVFKTHPNMLSLYEFYLLANEYEPGSQQFRDVITKASQMYPDEKINRLSMAVFSYMSGDIEAALGYLKGLEDDPDAWLYFSALHARNGELEKAELYARKAYVSGKNEAEHHLTLIERFKKEESEYREKQTEWEKYGINE